MLTGLTFFFVGYLISMTYTSVFYHRGLCHDAVKLSPFLTKLVEHTGMLITGIDPKGWVCMHRLHHEHSDTELDPHSPVHGGFWYTFIKQHKSFERVLIGLIRGKKKYTSIVEDIPFDVHPLNRKGLWWVSLSTHLLIGTIIGLALKNPWAGIGYFLGIGGHPIQGFLINSLGHAVGYRNFPEEPDNSRNNTFAAWFVFGEGYQNNHHKYPRSAKFSVRIFEFDPGFIVVKTLSLLGLLKINEIAPAYHKVPKQSEVKSA